MHMYFKKNFILFLQFLCFSQTLCFHKNIRFSSNIQHVNRILSVHKSIINDIPQTVLFSDILLPYLSSRDKIVLTSGEMIQKQERNCSNGFGIVIVDIPSDPQLVFDTLTLFGTYQEMIPIVRSSKIVSIDGVNTIAEFTLSRFLLRASVKHTIFKDDKILKFCLNSNSKNPIFKEVEGFWHVQIPEDRPSGYSRVYLSARILTHHAVPSLFMDYAASRALNRATEWLKPFFTQKISE